MRRLYAVLGWLVAALAATGVGVAALGALGTGIVGEAARPLSQQDVKRELRTATSRPSPSGSATATSTPESGAVVLSSSGGTVTAGCYADGTTRLDSWSPRQGYQVEEVHRGPAREVEIKFESDDAEVKGRIHCTGGHPTARWEQDD